MDISVVICTYNRAEDLRKTLEGFTKLAPMEGRTWELIVVDNCSADGTPGVCAEFDGKLPIKTACEGRPGKSFALNRGIGMAAAELIAVTDDDVDVDAQWLNALVRGAEQYPAAEFFGGKVVSHWQGEPPRWFAENKDMLRSNPRVDLGDKAVRFTRGERPVFVGANIALRRRAFAAGFTFSGDFGPRGDARRGGRVGPEEFEWQRKMLEAGCDGMYLPESIVHHRDPLWRMTESYVRHWYIDCGRLRVTEGEIPKGREWFGAPRYLWRELITNGLKFLATRFAAPSRVWLSAECRACIAWGSIVGCRESSNRKGIRGLHWRLERLCDRYEGLLTRLGPRAGVTARWPMRKPYERRALVLRAPGGGFGDELMCLPIFEEIKRRNPACRISFVTRRPDFFRAHPAIDGVIADSASAPGIKLSYNYVIPPPRPLMTLMAECVGIIAHFDRITLPPIVPSESTARLLDSLPRPLIVIQPLSSGWTTNKNWPIESWRALVPDLTADGAVLEIGTAPAFEGENFGPGFHSVAGQTSLSDMAEVIRRADLFIGPSSAGMHLANAHGVKSVIIFGGYESPAGYEYARTSAFYSPVECAPCWRQDCPYHLKCLHAIAPERVIAEARKLLATPRPAGQMS
ncbi:MAG: glycosyltransferase [Chthoniobacteraceae bacterium]|jgi:ADP-heptose:LPS heptosyltransferase/glycosyltransferase involved in cell wall biosynthesis